jgi:D-3-phosphoglycerate dehydrogenase / 2-oxoglutarate reductase
MDAKGKPFVYVLDPYHEDAFNHLKSSSDVQAILPPDAAKERALQEATAIMLRSETRIQAIDLDKAGPQLKYLVKQGVGVDNIDLAAAKAKGIGVYNTPGANAESVAELTLTLALCVARRVTELDRSIREGQHVIRSKMLAKSLFGKRLGIIGMGAIGMEVAKKWRGAMGGPLIGYDPRGDEGRWSDTFGTEHFQKTDDLHALLSSADVVTLHVPLTASTKNMISGREFDNMKDGAILLNLARGGIVDEEALLSALNSGKLFGAGLDAACQEPPSREVYGDGLLQHPRVVMTPHVGASTVESQSTIGIKAVDIMLDLVNGRGVHQSLA